MSSDVSSANGLTDSDSAPETKPWLQISVSDDDGNSRTARVTATIDGRKHRFEIEVASDSNVSDGDGLDSNNNFVVSIDHQETVNSRGTVRTAQPSDEVVDFVASHDDVRDFVSR